MRVREGDGQGCIARELPFNADYRLINRRGHEVGAHLLTNLHGLKPLRRRERRNGGKRESARVPILKYVLVLAFAVAAKRSHRVCQPKTIIEDAESGAGHGLWRHSPRDANPRCEVVSVTNVGLRFVTEAEAHGQRRTDLPVVSDENSEIELTC